MTADTDFDGPTPSSLLLALLESDDGTEADTPPEMVRRAVDIGRRRARTETDE